MSLLKELLSPFGKLIYFHCIRSINFLGIVFVLKLSSKQSYYMIKYDPLFWLTKIGLTCVTLEIICEAHGIYLIPIGKIGKMYSPRQPVV